MHIGHHNGKKIQDNAKADLEKKKEKTDKRLIVADRNKHNI